MIEKKFIDYILHISEDSITFLKSQSVFVDNAINMNTIIVFFCIFIMCVIAALLYNIYFYFSEDVNTNIMASKINENTLIEWIFMLTPLFIVYFLIIASMGSIYMLDEFHDTTSNLYITGNQWKWNYTVEEIFISVDLNNFLNYNKILNFFEDAYHIL